MLIYTGLGTKIFLWELKASLCKREDSLHGHSLPPRLPTLVTCQRVPNFYVHRISPDIIYILTVLEDGAVFNYFTVEFLLVSLLTGHNVCFSVFSHLVFPLNNIFISGQLGLEEVVGGGGEPSSLLYGTFPFPSGLLIYYFISEEMSSMFVAVCMCLSFPCLIYWRRKWMWLRWHTWESAASEKIPFMDSLRHKLLSVEYL